MILAPDCGMKYLPRDVAFGKLRRWWRRRDSCGPSSVAEPAPAIAGDLLTLAEIQSLRRLSSLRGATLVLHAWATIAGAMILYALWPSPLTLVLAVAIIGARQLGLMVLVHEAVHWRLFERGEGQRPGRALALRPSRVGRAAGLPPAP